MGEDRASLLFTSPPYGNQRDYTTGGGTDWDALMQGVFQNLDAAKAAVLAGEERVFDDLASARGIPGATLTNV